MSTWFLFLVLGLPLVVLLLFFGGVHLLGASSYLEPARLKRELREAHGEREETPQEEATDQLGWFGWIPGSSANRAFKVVCSILILLLLVLGGNWLLHNVHLPPSDGFKPTENLAAAPAAETLPVLTMDPNGDSRHMLVPVGHSLWFTGSGFTTHCHYTDGHEEVSDGVSRCSDGPILYQYAHNETDHQNSVTWRVN